MKALKKTISIALSLAMCASLVAPSFAAVEYDIANGNVYIGTDENGKTVSWQNENRKWAKDDKWKDGEKTTDSEIIIKQGETQYGFTQNTITVLGGVQGAAVTLDNVNIKGGFMYGDSTGAAFNIESGSSVDVTLKGSNRLVSGEESAMAGLDVAGGSSVTINGTGSDSLYAEGGKRAAGIGGGSFQKGGDVTINGGDITAVGGSAKTTYSHYSADEKQTQAGGAGIGSGGNGSAGDITINGGKVTATGGNGAAGIQTAKTDKGGGAGIGSGGGGSVGEITIKGGLINATGGEKNGGGAGIGTGANGETEDILITGGNVTAQGGSGVQVDSYGSPIGNVGGGAGIGSGSSGNQGKKSGTGSITIKDGGLINATGGDGAAGIGSGSATWHATYPDQYLESKTGDITIGEGSQVTANGGWAGAGIGTGQGGTAGDIEIDGAVVIANGGDEAPEESYINVAGEKIGAGAGIGTGHKGTAGQIKVSSGNVTAKANRTGAGIGTGNLGTVAGIEISKGLVTAEGGKGGAGIGTGYLGTVQNEIKISGDETRVEATGGEQGAGIGSSYLGTVNAAEISGGDVDAIGGAYGAGIGSGYLGTVNTVEISSADVTKVTEVTATGGDYAAAIGAGFAGKFNAISISGGDIVAQSGLWASAIGNGSDAQGGQAIGGTIAIQGVNSLIALGDSYWAIDTARSNVDGVNQSILNGWFLEEIGVDSSNGLNKVEKVEFVIVNAEGAEIKRFTLKPQGADNMYESFAVNLPEGGTYYVFSKDEAHYGSSIAGYETAGKKVVYAISENDMLNANLMQFPSFDVSYRFVSDTEGRELPASIAVPSRESGKSMTLAQLNRVIAGDGTYTDIKADGGAWHFEGWEPGKSAIDDTGILTDVELVGKWSFTAGPASPGSNPTNPATNPTVEIGDVDVPLAGIFTRADAIGYLWEQTGSPEWELSDFPDVPEDHEWAAAIGWAQDMGIAVADEDGNFRPDDPVLRSVEDLEVDPEGELQEFLNRYAVFAGIVLEPGELFIELAGEPDDVIMGEEAQAIFDDFFAKLEAALAQAA